MLVVCFVSLSGFSQNEYTVYPIPYQVYTVNVSVLNTSDDRYSGLIPLGFDFNFFGNSYNQVVISTNGYVDFTASRANSYSEWQLNMLVPNVSFAVKNSILGCFQDFNNSINNNNS